MGATLALLYRGCALPVVPSVFTLCRGCPRGDFPDIAGTGSRDDQISPPMRSGESPLRNSSVSKNKINIMVKKKKVRTHEINFTVSLKWVRTMWLKYVLRKNCWFFEQHSLLGFRRNEEDEQSTQFQTSFISTLVLLGTNSSPERYSTQIIVSAKPTEFFTQFLHLAKLT